jgi:sialic acid synthase SpsE
VNLARLSKRAGADAIKFQMGDYERLMSDPEQTLSYGIASGEIVTEPLLKILRRRELMQSEWIELKHLCDEFQIAFFCTALFDDEVDFLVEIGCPSIKISSGDVNHFPLIRKVAQSGVLVQLDTGNSTLGEIEEAVDVIVAEGNRDIIIHHCPSGYPARLDGINLNIIPTLKRMFPSLPIGFSDHTPGRDMDVAAVALGANLVEKTITLDRSQRSPEHMFSLEGVKEMTEFVQAIRDVERAMGSNRRYMTAKEREKRKAGRRSLYDGEWRRPER